MVLYGDFSSHVFIDDDEICGEKNTFMDQALATLLVLFTIIGIPSNIMALQYFILKSGKSLSTLLYIAICFVDICTIIVQFPVALSLFSGRDPVWFNSFIFCGAWVVAAQYIHQISMFLVMLLSVSRCIAIAVPFHKVHKKLVLLTIPLYSIFLIAVAVIAVSMSSIQIYYGPDAAYCYTWYNQTDDNDDSTKHTEPVSRNIDMPNNTDSAQPDKVWFQMERAIYTAGVGLPPVIAFISFIICIIKLGPASRLPRDRRGSVGSIGSCKSNKRAAVTVTLFTGLFLLCNIPFFMNMVLEAAVVAFGEYPTVIFCSQYMYWYSWTVSKILFTGLNATLNPVLYYCRMSGFKDWIKELFLFILR